MPEERIKIECRNICKERLIKSQASVEIAEPRNNREGIDPTNRIEVIQTRIEVRGGHHRPRSNPTGPNKYNDNDGSRPQQRRALQRIAPACIEYLRDRENYSYDEDGSDNVSSYREEKMQELKNKKRERPPQPNECDVRAVRLLANSQDICRGSAPPVVCGTHY